MKIVVENRQWQFRSLMYVCVAQLVRSIAMLCLLFINSNCCQMLYAYAMCVLWSYMEARVLEWMMFCQCQRQPIHRHQSDIYRWLQVASTRRCLVVSCSFSKIKINFKNLLFRSLLFIICNINNHTIHIHYCYKISQLVLLQAQLL